MTLVNENFEARQRINLPEGGHDEVLHGQFHPMVNDWGPQVQEIDEAVLTERGQDAGRLIEEVIPVLSYARVSLAAWSLCNVASIKSGDFDPVEFGKRCGAIAREQIERYRLSEGGSITQ